MSDLISRHDAMLKVAKVDKNKYADMTDFHDACVDCLKNLPPAQPERNCVLTTWGDCSYNETGCSDCEIKAKITKALSVQTIKKVAVNGCSNCKHGEYNDHWQVYLCDFANECPNFDKWEPAEYKVGEWVAYGDIPTECPFCGEDWDKYVFGDVEYTDDLPKFCPKCGADMRGEEE